MDTTNLGIGKYIKDEYKIFEQRFSFEWENLFKEYFEKNPVRASSLGWTSLAMWSEVLNHSWEEIENHLCMAGSNWEAIEKGKLFMYPPFPKNGVYEAETLRRTVLTAREKAKAKGLDIDIILVPSEFSGVFAEALKGFSVVREDRDNWDYIYEREALETLAGRGFSHKRNHLNAFLRHEIYSYEELDPADSEEIVEFLDEHIEEKGMNGRLDFHLIEERNAILRALSIYREAGYLGGVVRMRNKIKAFTFGGRLNHNTFSTHVEKADPAIRGLYQIINRDFAAHLPPEIEYINREEDMGIEGLRRAKESYLPCKMLETLCYELK